jgi:hypothetical protein
MNYNSFAENVWVQYHSIKGPIKFVCHKYITLCINPQNSKQRQTNLLVYCTEWNDVTLFQESCK